VRRLENSPRLIVLIATIGIAQIVIVGRLILPKPKTKGQTIFAGGGVDFPVPVHWHSWTFGRVIFLPQHLLVLVVGPLLALAVFTFLKWSPYGMALRAAAENSTRARLLGVPVRRVSTLSWVVASLLSASASILLAPVVGFSSTEAVGLPLLMRGLAAATIAGMNDVKTAFYVGVGLGVADQLVFYSTGRNGLTDLVLFAIVVVSLCVRRTTRRRTVGAEESSWELAEPVRALPDAIATHPRWRAVRVGALLTGAVAAVAAPFALRPSTTYLVGTIALVAAVCVSLTLLTGWAGQVSLGQWGIAGVGGVLGGHLVTRNGVSFWLALLAAAAVGGLAALLIGLPALRLAGAELAVVTLGFGVAGSTWLFNQPWFRGDGKLPIPEWISTRWLYALCLAFLGVTVVAVRNLQASRIGRTTLAVRDNPAQAASLGVSVVRAKLTAFVVAGVVAGAAGFLFAAAVNQAEGTAFPPVRSLQIVSAAVIGGLGSVGGAVVGAVYLLAIPYFGGDISPFIGLAATGVGVLVLVLFLPGGLARALLAGRDRLAEAVTGIDPRPDVERFEPVPDLHVPVVPPLDEPVVVAPVAVAP
jgi:branched-chain amino acid transport system permease protein